MSASRPPARLALALVLALAAPLACHDGGPDDGNHGFTGALEAHFVADTVSQGEAAEIRVKLPTRADNAMFTVIATYGGMLRGADTLRVGGQSESLYGTLTAPPEAPDGELWIAFSVPGTRLRDTAYLTIRDRRPPIVTGSLAQVDPVLAMASMIPPDYQAAAGGRIAVNVEAIDNTTVQWVGYEFGAPFGRRDSTRVTATPGAGTSRAFTVQLPESLAGSAATITLFASDDRGNRATLPKGTTHFFRYLDRIAGSAGLDAPVRDVAYDAARDRVYLSQPTSKRIAVLSLATMTWLAPIAAPLPPAGLDLTVSGDSLLVALERSVYLGVVDLRAATPTVDTLRLRFTANPFVQTTATDMRPWPSGVRVAADGRALVSLATSSPEGGDKLLALDLATGAQAVLVAGSGAALALERSGDRRSVLLTGDGFGGVRYRVATHDIAYVDVTGFPTTGRVYTTSPVPKIDAAGTFHLFGTDVYDAELRWQRRIGGADVLSHLTAISPDGADVYLASVASCPAGESPPCFNGVVPGGLYHRFDRASGELVEIVRTPELMPTLVPLPDGRRMLAIGASKVALFDLTPAGARTPSLATTPTVQAAMPAPAAVVAPRDARLSGVRWRAPR